MVIKYIFLLMHTILLSNMINYIYKKFLNKINLKCLLYFQIHFYEVFLIFLGVLIILSLLIFFSKMSIDISLIYL